MRRKMKTLIAGLGVATLALVGCTSEPTADEKNRNEIGRAHV